MQEYIKALAPNTTAEQRIDPAYSPFYENMRETAKKGAAGTLPPALFTVGTEDPLLDDSIVMSAKWQMSGAVGPLRVYPGAPHGFSMFPPDVLDASKQWRDDVEAFFGEHL